MTMNPFSSRPTRPATSPVRGEAPIIANTAAVGSRSLSPIAADDRHRLELLAAVEGLDLAALPDLHVLGGLDAIDEIARHRRVQRPPNHEVDAPGVSGEVDHRLPGRVAAADHDHVLARGLERLEVGRRVEEAQTLKALGSFGRQATVVGTDGENDATGADLLTVAEPQIPQSAGLRTSRSDTLRGRWR